MALWQGLKIGLKAGWEAAWDILRGKQPESEPKEEQQAARNERPAGVRPAANVPPPAAPKVVIPQVVFHTTDERREKAEFAVGAMVEVAEGCEGMNLAVRIAWFFIHNPWAAAAFAAILPASLGGLLLFLIKAACVLGVAWLLRKFKVVPLVVRALRELGEVLHTTEEALEKLWPLLVEAFTRLLHRLSEAWA
jgi:hypothetical protein